MSTQGNPTRADSIEVHQADSVEQRLDPIKSRHCDYHAGLHALEHHIGDAAVHQILLHRSANQFHSNIHGGSNKGKEAKQRDCDICAEPDCLSTPCLEAPEYGEE